MTFALDDVDRLALATRELLQNIYTTKPVAVPAMHSVGNQKQ
jgi:hypothetical protein